MPILIGGRLSRPSDWSKINDVEWQITYTIDGKKHTRREPGDIQCLLCGRPIAKTDNIKFCDACDHAIVRWRFGWTKRMPKHYKLAIERYLKSIPSVVPKR